MKQTGFERGWHLAVAVLLVAVGLARGGTCSAVSAATTFDFRDYTLTVASAQPTATPAVGTHTYAWRTAVTCSVADESATHTPTGWVGTGSVPSEGETVNTGEITLTDLDSSITWQWAASATDTDGDGIDDAWEMQYFGNLHQIADGDFDADGRTNAEEYADGTDPADPGSTLGLVAYYPFDGNANDASGNGINGTATAIGYGEDVLGNSSSAAIFDGSTSVIDFGNTISSSRDFTISTWVKRDVTYLDDNYPFYIQTRNGELGYRLSDGKVRVNVQPKRDGGLYASAAAESNDYYDVLDNDWVLLTAVVRDDDSVDFFENGIEISSVFHEYQSDSQTGDYYHFVIGAQKKGTSTTYYHRFKGSIDEVRIYSRALSSSEVARLYASTGGSTPPTTLSPDLSLSSLDLRILSSTGVETYDPAVGDTVNIEVTVRNLGETATAADGVVQVFLDGAPTDLASYDLADYVVAASATIPSPIAAGGSVTLLLPWTVTGPDRVATLTAVAEFTANRAQAQANAAGGTAESPVAELSFANNSVGRSVQIGSVTVGESRIEVLAAAPAGMVSGASYTLAGTARYDWGTNEPVLGALVTAVADGQTYTARTTSPDGAWSVTLNGLPEGEHTAQIVVDDGHLVGSLDLTLVVGAGPQTVDLRVKQMGFASDTYRIEGETGYATIGSSVVLKALVRNDGNTGSGSFDVTFKDPSGTAVCTVAATLAAFSETWVSASTGWPAEVGAQTLTVVADSGDAVAESNEANNQRACTLVGTEALADLVVTGIGFAPGAPKEGDELTLTATVRNQGAATLPAGSAFATVFTPGGTVDTTLAADLGPGDSIAVAVVWTAVAGTYSVKAEADSGGAVAETIESNNVGTQTLTVRQALPDLRPFYYLYGHEYSYYYRSGLSFTPSQPLAGEAVTVACDIYNSGTVAVAAGTAFSVVFSADGTPFATNSVTLAADLAPGTKLPTSVSWGGGAAGTVAFTVALDTTETVVEESETNNTTSLSLVVSSDDTDLVAAGLTFSPLQPLPGASVALTATVRNNGGVAGGSGEVVEFFAGTTNPADKIGETALADDVPGKGGTRTAAFAWTAPATAGVVTISAMVNGTVVSRALTVTANPLPNLHVFSEDIAVTPALPQSGETVTVTAEVRNTEGATATSFLVRFSVDTPAGGWVELGAPVAVAELAAGSSVVVTAGATITATRSAYGVKAEVVPNATQGDADSSDNAATTSFLLADVPMADAGADAETFVAQSVLLDGTGSRNATAYAWTLVAWPTGSTAGLTGAATATAQLTPDLPGLYTVRLVVSDGTMQSAPDTVVITARPEPTYALTVTNGTGDGSYTAGTVVTVTADAAPDGQEFAGWTADPAEHAIHLANADVSPTTFTMPAAAVTLAATYVDIPYSGGEGTAGAPYRIATKQDLLELAANTADYSKHFVLTADIDLTGEVFTTAVIAPDTSGQGYSSCLPFTGRLDGDGHAVRNLTITVASSDASCLGLFGRLGTSSEVRNLGVEDARIVGGTDSESIGVLCGANEGQISGCLATGSVSGRYFVGGLCGISWGGGSVSDCYANVSVAATGGGGGFCGFSGEASFRNCYAIGLVQGPRWMSGFCGGDSYEGTFTDCYFYAVAGPDNGFGDPLDADQLQDSACLPGFDFAGTSADGTDDIWIITPGHCPRLTWQPAEDALPLPTPPATTLAGVGAADDPFVIASRGDFDEFRSNAALVGGCYSLQADLDLAGSTFTSAPVNRCFGGVFLGNGHVIRNLAVDTGEANTSFLGLFSVFYGTALELGLENVRIVGGSESSHVGALCGLSDYARIDRCYATGTVTGGQSVGGLVGSGGNGTITRCYAVGAVAGDSWGLGGLCGTGGREVSNCYAVVIVSGPSPVDGLCGSPYLGAVTGSFWDTEVSGVSASGGGTGKTTAELQTQATFTDAGWDFVGETANGTDDIWYMDGYPALNCLRAAASHALTVNSGDGDGNYTAATAVTVTATDAPDGQEFAGWTADPAEYVTNLENADASPTTFTMPAAAVTLTATYAAKTYTVVFDFGDHGTRTGGGDVAQTVIHGQGAVAPEFTVAAGWMFTGWDTAFAAVTADLSVTAQYVRTWWFVDCDATGAGNGQTWADAFATLQPAIDAASAVGAGDVWVAEGTYKPADTTDRTASIVLRSNVAVYGGFAGTETTREERDWRAHPTVLSGDIGETGVKTDNSFSVLRAVSETGPVVLDGLTVTGGYADQDVGMEFPEGNGGGLYVYQCASVVVRNSTFVGNEALVYGGGACVLYSEAEFVDVVFRQNAATGTEWRGLGGGLCGGNDVTVAVTRCLFENNTATTGGGLSCKNLTMTHSIVRNNQAASGGGIHVPDSSGVVSRTVVHDNSAVTLGGGIYCGNSAVDIESVLLANNHCGTWGGGLGVYKGQVDVTGTTFFGNTCPTGASVEIHGGPVLTVRNSILWDETPANPATDGTATFTNSLVRGTGGSDAWAVGFWSDGGGNIDADPRFADSSDPDGPDDVWGTADDGLRLAKGSPCIDSGAGGADVSVTDLLDNARWDDPGIANTGSGTPDYVDMGSYEFQGTSSYTVTFDLGDHGTHTGGGDVVQTVIHGQGAVAPDFTVAAGWTFTGWDTDFSAVTADLTVSAQYAPIYTLTVTSGTGDGSYTAGTVVTVTGDTAPEGHRFAGWTADPAEHAIHLANADVSPTTFTMPAATVTLTATFAINTYTLTYTAGDGGTISGTTPQTVSHGRDGSEVEAVPATGYHFVSWSDGVATAKRTDTNVTSDLTVTAHYESADPFGVPVAYPSTAMTVLCSPWIYGIAANEGDLIAAFVGDELRGKSEVLAIADQPVANLTISVAQAGETVHFRIWQRATGTVLDFHETVVTEVGGSVGSYPDDLFQLTVRYSVSYQAAANGAIAGQELQFVIAGESTVAVQAVSHAGYHFVDWSDGSTSNPRTDENVSADLAFTATFALNDLSVLVNDAAPVVPEGGSVVVGVTLSGQPAGDIVLGVTSDGGASPSASPTTLTFTESNWNVAQAVTLSAAEDDADTADGSATFTVARTAGVNPVASATVAATEADDDFLLTLADDGHGTTAGSGIVDRDDAPYAVSATPATGYHFAAWTGADVAKLASATSAATTIDTDTDATVTATFALNTYTISATAGDNGAVTPSGAVPATHGTDRLFSFAPAEGYRVADVQVDGASLGPVGTYTFTAVDRDHTIHVEFERITRTQTIALLAGWNNVSLNVHGGDMSPSRVFSSVIANVAKIIAGNANFDPALPPVVNTLKSFDVGQGIWVRVNADCTLVFAEVPAPVATSLSLTTGWNHIGYLPQEGMPIGTALQTLGGALDKVVGRNANYDPDLPEVINTLKTMEPGLGYWAKVSAPCTLVYPAARAERTGEGTVPTTDAARSRVEVSPFGPPVGYPTTAQTVLARITIDGGNVSSEDWVGAFVGSECRGATQIVPYDGKTYANLTVSVATAGETAEFRLYDAAGDVTLNSDFALTLAPGGSAGTLGAPVEIAFTTPVTQHSVTFKPGLHGALVGGDPDVVTMVGDGVPVPTVPAVTAEDGWTHMGWDWTAARRGDAPATITQDWTVTALYAEAVPAAPTWQIGLVLGGAAPTTLTFGMRSDATDGWDPGIDVDYPLPGPGQACLAADDLELSYSTDLRAPAEAATFLLVASAAPGTPVTVAWGASALPEGKFLTIYEVILDGIAPTRTPVVWTLVGNTARNLALASSLEIPAGETRCYVIRYGDDLVFDLAFAAGWNLVSLPIEPLDPAAESVLDAGVTRGDSVLRDGLRGTISSRSVWSWQGQRYAAVDELHACVGYWVHASTPAVLLVPGKPVVQTGLDLVQGWNLCGAAEVRAVPVDARIRGAVWWWDAVLLSYGTATEFQPGWGYWINANVGEGAQVPFLR